MKITLLLVVMIFLSTLSFAQPFGGNGASWYYSISSLSFPPRDIPVQVTSSPPFIFGSDTCLTISITNGDDCMYSSSYIVKESNDSVYYYLPSSGQFEMLYNYNAVVGDTQTISGLDVTGNITSFQLVVTSNGTININGFIKKIYTTSHINFPNYFDFGDTIIEDIGSITYFLFPQWGFCDPVILKMRCYEDSVIGLYNSQSPISCDSVIWLATYNLELNINIDISPNPFSSVIFINSKKKNVNQVSLVVRNILGITVHRELENSLNKEYNKTLDLNILENGVYFLELSFDEYKIVKKIIKE